MKIRLLFIALFITLLTSNSAWAHSFGGHLHSWYALDHIIIALGIGFIAFLLFKMLLVFFKKERSKKSLNMQGALKKPSANK